MKNKYKDLIRIEKRKNNDIIIYHYLYIDIKVNLKKKIIDIVQYRHNHFINDIIKDFKERFNTENYIIYNYKKYFEYQNNFKEYC